MRVLIIEDEAKIASFLKEALVAECFAVDVGSDGQEGAHLAHINEYDLIILDYMLPEKDGHQVLKELRADDIKSPILVISARNEVIDKVDLLNAGADDYTTKPFALSEVLARIHALLRRPQALEDDIIQIDDLILDNVGCTVKRGDKDIYLTRKEFALLRYLMQHRGIVLSRSMLLEHVWDMNADIFSNTIESHILSLRKKLGDTGKDRLIKTVPGRGYKIEG